MLRDKAMSAYRDTGSGRALQLLNMHSEMIGPIASGSLERIGSLNAEAAERAIGNVSSKFFEQIEIAFGAKIADDAFQGARDAFHTEATRHTLATRFFREIAAAL